MRRTAALPGGRRKPGLTKTSSRWSLATTIARIPKMSSSYRRTSTAMTTMWPPGRRHRREAGSVNSGAGSKRSSRVQVKLPECVQFVDLQ